MEISPERVAQLTKRELEAFEQANRNSFELVRRAVQVMPLGVPTNVCALSPYPVAVTRGRGAYLTSLDGQQLVDYHNGFGTTIFGHAHPKIVAAIAEQAARGSHFGTMTEQVVPWAEHLCDRFRLDWIRFSNSGTEATMDALRLARAYTSRVKVAKIEGGYHGSHEAALISTNMAFDGTEGPDEQPAARRWGQGLSERLLDEVVVLPFNDIAAARKLLEGGEIAGLIVEPVMFNVGTIFPYDGYLHELRELCDRTGTLLIFDETKTGATIAHGGAEQYFGARPHIKTIGKGIGGGLTVGALGGTDDRLYELIETYAVPHLGTFGGNPLVAAAGLAAMTEVMTPEAYETLDRHCALLDEKLGEVVGEFELPAYVIGAGAKSCLVWARGRPLRDFRDYRRRFNFPLGYLAWLYLLRAGVMLSPGQDEQLTFGIDHGPREAETLAAAVRDLAVELRA